VTADAPEASAAASPPPTASPSPKAEAGATAGARADEGSEAPAFSTSGHKALDEQGAAEDYARGRETLRPPASATYVSGGRDQQVYVGDRIYYQLARPAVPEPGEVRQEQLRLRRNRYVRIPHYRQILNDLERRRLLVLVGSPGTGRTTTAVQLLDALTNGIVFRLEPEIDLRTIDESMVGKGRGSLAVLSGPPTPPTKAQADRLAALLARQGSFCVVVATPTPAVLRAFAEYRADCSPPPFAELLRGHLDAALTAEDPAGWVDDLVTLAMGSKLQQALGAAPRASEVAELALLLVDYKRGKLRFEDVSARTEAFLERRIERWFSELGGSPRRDVVERGLRLAALRVALAVFDGLPQHIVTTTGADLGDRLVQTGTPESGTSRPALSRPVAPDFDATSVATFDAELVDEDITYGGVQIPSQVIHYLNRRTPAVLLTYLWRRHQPLRRPIIDWLWGLSAHREWIVQIRAAQAAGLLAAADFSHTFPALIEPAAMARPSRRRPVDPTHDEDSDEFDADDATWELRREFAAIALDQAALDDRVRPMVVEVLRRWRRSSEFPLRWTAARTLGLDFGLVSLAKSLDDLRVIGTPWELLETDDVPAHERAQVRDLWWVAGFSIARLFAIGGDEDVLEQLAQWLRHKRKSVRELAQQAVLTMAVLKMSTVRVEARGQQGTPAAPASRERWPVALALSVENPPLTGRIAGLIRTVLGSGPAGEVLIKDIGSWWELGNTDPSVIDAFLELVPHIVVDERDRNRLDHAVDRACRRWDDPLPSDVAVRIRAETSAAIRNRRS
jgi:hypothetical protein